MASIPVATAWSDPSSILTAGKSYFVQNKSSAAVQLFVGAAFDATTNDADGAILSPAHYGGAGVNSLILKYVASSEIRIRQSGSGFGNGNTVEFLGVD